MTELAECWRQRAVAGFRAAYRKAMRGCPSYPASKKQARGLITFFSLERTMYKLPYELANRPDWAEIPLKAVLAILQQPAGDDRLLDD